MQDLAKEAVSYSVMMSRIATLFFIDAVGVCCIAHGFSNLEHFQHVRASVTKAIEDISSDAGVPKEI